MQYSGTNNNRSRASALQEQRHHQSDWRVWLDLSRLEHFVQTYDTMSDGTYSGHGDDFVALLYSLPPAPTTGRYGHARVKKDSFFGDDNSVVADNDMTRADSSVMMDEILASQMAFDDEDDYDFDGSELLPPYNPPTVPPTAGLRQPSPQTQKSSLVQNQQPTSSSRPHKEDEDDNIHQLSSALQSTSLATNPCQPAITKTLDPGQNRPRNLNDNTWRHRVQLLTEYQTWRQQQAKTIAPTVRINIDDAVVRFRQHSDNNTFRPKQKGRAIETLGVFAGKDDGEGGFIVTHLIIPKQVGEPDNVTATDEGEVELVRVFIENDISQLGWIHTHPGHDLYLSSVDVHQQYRYQNVLPSYFAMVYAPTSKPPICVYSLSDFGMWMVRNCERDNNPQGFHMHAPGAYPDQHELRSVMFGVAPHVIADNTLAPVKVFDLRGQQ